MLIYEAQGFIEVEADDIKKLERSVASVTIGTTESGSFDVQVAFCEQLEGSKSRYTVAFYAKSLKKALIFSVKSPENISPWQHGQDILAGLGFKLEAVNLRLSPAMREVVLRDVPGVISPAEARRLRTEKAELMKGLQNEIDKDPKSKAGKKAALKLGSEMRLNEHAEIILQALNELLAPREVNADLDSAIEQVKDLTARLEAAEVRLEEERKQREMSESITAAAEKRIQELEEVLVDVETRSAGELKQKRRVVKLQSRVKKLEEQLESATAAVESEKKTREQFVDDVKSANEQIAALETKLKDSEDALTQNLDRLAEAETDNEELQASVEQAHSHTRMLEGKLKEAHKELDNSLGRLAEQEQAHLQLTEAMQKTEDNVHKLGMELESASAKISQLGEVKEATCELQKEQEETKASLRASLDEKQAIIDQLSAAEEKIVQLEVELKQASEASDKGATVDDQQLEVQAELDQQIRQHEELHDLKTQLQDERASREKLEKELDQAHKIIDSLEKVVRESAKDSGNIAAEKSEDAQKIIKLEAKLELLAEQLEQEQSKQEKLAEAFAEAESRSAAEEQPVKKRPLNKNVKTAIDPNVENETEERKPVKSNKPLPHELRPTPVKGALFNPDWDLEGLPCQSGEQVFKAWETVFNVQIALDGYPSQYCMAFLVVLRIKKVKKLFMLFRLKQNKHTLVKVPARTPKNEKGLKEAIREGLKFLKASGFEMEEMPKEYIESTLGGFFLKK